MKPVGLRDPRTGKRPYAVVQLRRENLRSDSYNLVGFQNHLKFGEQKRILRMIPGLESAEFLRYGQIHRNTYLSPRLASPTLQLRSGPGFFSPDGYPGSSDTESHGSGPDGGRWGRLAPPGELPPAPRYCLRLALPLMTHANPKTTSRRTLRPPPLCAATPASRDKHQRHALQCQIALRRFDEWLTAYSPRYRAWSCLLEPLVDLLPLRVDRNRHRHPGRGVVEFHSATQTTNSIPSPGRFRSFPTHTLLNPARFPTISPVAFLKLSKSFCVAPSNRNTCRMVFWCVACLFHQHIATNKHNAVDLKTNFSRQIFCMD